MDSPDEELIQLLTDSTNREILTVLNDASHGLSVTELADQLVSEDDGDVDRTVIALHHNYLPRLDEAGLLGYDCDEKLVTEGHYSADDAECLSKDVLDELIAQFRPKRETSDNAVRRLEGREDVYDYSRKLADRAEDELFLIYASEDLLDEACLSHAERAIERGVEFYAGTKCRAAREFFRDQLPETTIWEPQMDWMYEQSSYPKVSRLIFADREHVVVGLWDEDRDGTKTEVAMVGEGKSNPLVVLVRELLGPRLDHLDYQSDDFLGDLPFET